MRHLVEIRLNMQRQYVIFSAMQNSMQGGYPDMVKTWRPRQVRFNGTQSDDYYA